MKRLLAAVVAASLLLAGCETAKDKFVGNYDGAIDTPPDLIEAIKLFAVQNELDPDEVEAAMVDSKIDLELRDDGTCSMTTTLAGNHKRTAGTWTLNDEGTKITIRVTMDEDTAINLGLPGGLRRDRVLDISNDGRTLTFEDTILRRKVVTTFTRN